MNNNREMLYSSSSMEMTATILESSSEALQTRSYLRSYKIETGSYISEIQNKADSQYASPLLLFLLTVYLPNMIMDLQVFKG